MNTRSIVLALVRSCCPLLLASAAMAQPANDLCSGATPASVNTVYYGNTTTATSTNDGPAPTCQTSWNRSVWFTFTPPAAGDYQISTCGTTFDSIVSIFDVVDCTTFVSGSFHQLTGGCDDDSCGTIAGAGTSSGNAAVIRTITLAAGTTYYIRISGWSTSSGAYQFAVLGAGANGACCTTSGTCSVTSAASCVPLDSSSYFLGAGTTCGVNPCVGSCCSCGTCSLVTPSSCASGWGGFGSTCAAVVCPTPAPNDLCSNPLVIGSLPYASGALAVGCVTDDAVNPSCDSSSNTIARQGIWFAYTPSTNQGVVMGQTGSEDTAKSVWTGSCGSLTQLAASCYDTETGNPVGLSAGVTYYFLVSKWSSSNYGTSSTVTFTLASGTVVACCSNTTAACTFATTSCGSGTTAAASGVCSPDPCVALAGACCATAGTCTSTLAAGCTGTNTFRGPGTACTPNPCGGACCTTSGTCSTSTAAGCTGTNIFQGLGSACTPNPCGGACCNTVSGTCTSSTAALCVGANTAFQGNGTACSPTSPCTGACCNTATAACTLTVAAGCATAPANNFLGLNTSCSASPCPTGACCSTSSGFCALTGPTGCGPNPGPRTYGGNGSVCSAAFCPVPGAPTNDSCNIPEPSGFNFSGVSSFTVIGQLKTATPDGTTGSPDVSPSASPCSTSDTWIGGQGNAVYYSFTPSLSTNYAVGVCNPNNVWDSVVSVHTACPPSRANSLACNDDGACAGGVGLSFINAVPLSAGTTYIIRVAAYATGTTINNGEFTLQVTGDPIGACCKTDGSCSPFTAASCSTQSGVYQGDGSSCSTAVCTGACCSNATAACTTTGAAGCGSGFTFGGVGSACSTTVCAGVACCNPDTAVCVRTGPAGCSSPNTNQGDVACSPIPCPGGACCTVGSSTCTFTGASGCSGTFQGPGSTCTPNVCAGACCNAATGVCTLGPTLGGCPSGQTFQGAGSSCTINPCPQPPPPSNDFCSAASTIVVGAPAISGTTAFSTEEYGATTPSGFCTGSTFDVFYQFTAAGAGPYGISMTNATDHSVLVLANCGDTTTIACSAIDFDNQITSFNIPAAGTYYIRVAAFSGDRGPFTIEIHAVVQGACCDNITGACATSAVGGTCTAGSTYQGNNTTCTASPCLQGACCSAATGLCSTASGAANCASGTTYQGDGTTCATAGCPQPPPPGNDACETPVNLTVGVAYQGQNATATDDTAFVPTCQTNSHKGVWFTVTAPATTNFIVTSCGTPFDCILSVWSGADCTSLTQVACDDDSCDGTGDSPNPGPANPGSGNAAKIASVAMTAGQTYRIMLSTYSTGTGGAYGVLVQYVNPPAGVCCRGATCSTAYTSAAACATALNSTSATVLSKFVSTSSTCNTPVTVPGTLGNTTSPCCYANYNHNATLEVQDIFDYLNDWFAGKKAALVGGDGDTGTLAVQNIFDFLNAWFAGGCN